MPDHTAKCMETYNLFYAGLVCSFLHTWRKGNKTIKDSGFILKGKTKLNSIIDYVRGFSSHPLLILSRPGGAEQTEP
jgi:hypothetical protein